MAPERHLLAPHRLGTEPLWAGRGEPGGVGSRALSRTRGGLGPPARTRRHATRRDNWTAVSC